MALDSNPCDDAYDGETTLDELVARLIMLEEEGASGPDALGRLCSEHPALASNLRKRYGLLVEMGMTAASSSAEPATVPERLGEFELLEPLGRGGMGIVYRARQVSLRREVALKLVRPEHLWFEGAKQRFQHEVETVARLSHPGIVPVHAVGEEQGLPWFAMELVRGCTLAQALKRLGVREPRRLDGSDLARAVNDEMGLAPTDDVPDIFRGSWTDVCLRIVRAIAEALEHAHRSGVLHRDIKPSNVMLSPEGRVMLLDFGLSSEEGGGNETRTGSHAGSLAYMAPELLAGEARPSRASDVYGLGVTLYELLTLHMPFGGMSAPELRQRIVEARPSAVRERNPGASWEAETVCMAAMERAPELRYATAADLAVDLSNVLERRPIMARRPGPALRARRFVERHPVAAVAVLVLMLAVPLTWALQERRSRRQLTDKNVELAVALTRAQTNFEAALDAVDELLGKVGFDVLRDEPGLDPLRRELLELATRFYERFLEQHEGDPNLVFELARAHCESATVQARLGEMEAATASYATSAKLLAQLDAETPGRPALRYQLAAGQSYHGDLLQRMGRFEQAESVLAAAIDGFSGLIDEGAAGPDVRIDRAIARCHLAAVLSQQGEYARSEALTRTAIAALDQLLLEDAGDFVHLEQLSNALWLLTINLENQGRHDEAWPVLERGLEVVARFRLEFPNIPSARNIEARLLNERASLTLLSEGSAPALELFERNLLALEELVAEFPGVLNYEDMLLAARMNVAALAIRVADGDAALAACLAAHEACGETVERRPAAAEYRVRLAMCEALLAGGLWRVEDLESAREIGLAARAKLEEFQEAFPGRVDLAATCFDLQLILASVAQDDDAPAEALGELRRAAELPHLFSHHWRDLAQRLRRLAPSLEPGSAAAGACAEAVRAAQQRAES